MKCKDCAEQATIHVTEIADGKARAEHFCQAHAPFPPPPGAGTPEREVDMILTVTERQVRNGETVEIRTLDGRIEKLRLSPGMLRAAKTGWPVRVLKRGREGEVLFYVHVKVVPDGGTGDARP